MSTDINGRRSVEIGFSNPRTTTSCPFVIPPSRPPPCSPPREPPPLPVVVNRVLHLRSERLRRFVRLRQSPRPSPPASTESPAPDARPAACPTAMCEPSPTGSPVRPHLENPAHCVARPVRLVHHFLHPRFASAIHAAQQHFVLPPAHEVSSHSTGRSHAHRPPAPRGSAPRSRTPPETPSPAPPPPRAPSSRARSPAPECSARR
jgi:hypothetical protein